jgi:hypothetical protein
MAANTNDTNKPGEPATPAAAPVDQAPGNEQTDGEDHGDGANGQQPDSRCHSTPPMTTRDEYKTRVKKNR